jgi:hypothetical protein
MNKLSRSPMVDEDLAGEVAEIPIEAVVEEDKVRKSSIKNSLNVTNATN